MSVVHFRLQKTTAIWKQQGVFELSPIRRLALSPIQLQIRII